MVLRPSRVYKKLLTALNIALESLEALELLEVDMGTTVGHVTRAQKAAIEVGHNELPTDEVSE